LKSVQKNEEGGQSSTNNDGIRYRCGGEDHWIRTCRTPKHLVDLYQQSLKNKDKKVESHFACDDDDFDYGNMDVTPLDVADFFADPDEKIDHLMGDGGVQK
jgi:hypothetical protein